MKGDRVEAMVDTGQGVQTFEIVATKAGRRIEVVTSRGVGRGPRGHPDRRSGPHRPVHGQPSDRPRRAPRRRRARPGRDQHQPPVAAARLGARRRRQQVEQRQHDEDGHAQRRADQRPDERDQVARRTEPVAAGDRRDRPTLRRRPEDARARADLVPEHVERDRDHDERGGVDEDTDLGARVASVAASSAVGNGTNPTVEQQQEVRQDEAVV